MATANKVAPIMRLPPELLTKVFREINPQSPPDATLASRLVCKSWNVLITTTPVLWQDLVLYGRESHPHPITLAEPLKHLEKTKICLRYSEGNIRSLTLHEWWSPLHPQELDDIEVIVSLLPWAKLRAINFTDHGDTIPTFLLDKIRLCSNIRFVNFDVRGTHALFEADDPIAACIKDRVAIKLRLSQVSERGFFAKVFNRNLLARSKEICLDWGAVEHLSEHNWSHLTDVVAHVVATGFCQRLSMRSVWTEPMPYTDRYCYATVGLTDIDLTGATATRSISETATTRSSLSLKHIVAYDALVKFTSLRNVRVKHLRLHGLSYEAMTGLTAMYAGWHELESVLIERCTCDKYGVEGLRQAQVILDILAQASPARLRTVELQGFAEWSGSESLEDVKGIVDCLVDAEHSVNEEF